MRHVLVIAVALAACTTSPAPSPEYGEARRRHAEVLAAHPADAAARPEMDPVLDLLGRVPPPSSDAPAAAELRARIVADRKALADETARRREIVEKAAQPGTMPPPAATPREPAAAPAEVRPDAAAALVRGTKLDDFRARTGDCFEKKTDIEILDGTVTRAGEAWALKDGKACAERHAAYGGKYVLFADGGYVSTEPQSAARTVTREVPRPAAPPASAPATGDAARPAGGAPR